MEQHLAGNARIVTVITSIWAGLFAVLVFNALTN